MCFALPKKVLKVSQNYALVEGGQKVKIGKLKLSTGDYVLVFADIAIEKVSQKEAEYTRSLAKRVV